MYTKRKQPQDINSPCPNGDYLIDSRHRSEFKEIPTINVCGFAFWKMTMYKYMGFAPTKKKS